MVVRALLASAALSTCLAVPAAAQDGARTFKPKSVWAADYGDDYCRLIRTYSDGKDELSLAFERTQPGEPVRLLLVGQGLSTFHSADQIEYRFLPAGPGGKTRYVQAETTEGKQFLSLEPVTLAAPAAPRPYDHAQELVAAAAITGLALEGGMTEPVRLETGSLKAAIGAMQTCTDDLLKVWGLDPAKHQSMTAAAMPAPETRGILPQGMIPIADYGKLVGSANQVRLIVGADGKPSLCAIYSPSLSPALNERICSTLMAKATFQPARDGTGQPMASVWMGPALAFGPPPPQGFGR